jgi:hypothetical protein
MNETRIRIRWLVMVVGLIGWWPWQPQALADGGSMLDELQSYLRQGKIADGAKAFSKQLQEKPDDATCRASLGILQFLEAFEKLGQAYYRFGVNSKNRQVVTFFQIDVPKNDHPEEISSADARAFLVQFLEQLQRSEKTLSELKPSGLKLPLDVCKIYLDIDKDGLTSERESFARIMSTIMGSGARNQAIPASITFAFDDADMVWLRGYTHVLSGIFEMMLAYDWDDAFDRVAHLICPRVKSPYMFLQQEGDSQFSWQSKELLDVIAFVHVLNFEVREGERMPKALEHFEQVIALSRETWRLIRLETDNDREWLPGPAQQSLILNNRVGGSMGDDWNLVLDQAERLLQGKELLPFWRGVHGSPISLFLNARNLDQMQFHPKLGINVRKIFTNPKRFDLVLWLQGTGVAPFLEEGQRIDLQSWQAMSGLFQGRLPFFAFWIN